MLPTGASGPGGAEFELGTRDADAMGDRDRGFGVRSGAHPGMRTRIAAPGKRLASPRCEGAITFWLMIPVKRPLGSVAR